MNELTPSQFLTCRFLQANERKKGHFDYHGAKRILFQKLDIIMAEAVENHKLI